MSKALWNLESILAYGHADNDMILITIFKVPSLRTPTNMFIINLALSDICMITTQVQPAWIQIRPCRKKTSVPDLKFKNHNSIRKLNICFSCLVFKKNRLLHSSINYQRPFPAQNRENWRPITYFHIKLFFYFYVRHCLSS